MSPRKGRKKYRYDRLIAVNAIFLILVAVIVVFIRINEKNAQLALPIPAFASEKIVSNLSSDPKKLFIPKITVEALIDPVGIAENGSMSLPRRLESVGWYKYGAGPGEEGNAVLAGHFDNGKGKGGVFYNLKNIISGDEVFVEDEVGGVVKFVVTETVLVDYENPSQEILKRVFGDTEESFLVLITCEGQWLEEKHSYTKRLIVFAKKA